MLADPPLKTVGILYHPTSAAEAVLAEELATVLPSMNAVAWLCSAWEEEQARGRVEGTDLLLSIGGDGTILKAARVALSHSIPIVGVNLGRLGFMTELGPDEARDKLPQYLRGEGWIDERAMLEVHLADRGRYHALNDVFVGRGAIPRLVQVETSIDGAHLTTYRADGVIVSTATGSTGYSLAAGGPILYPRAREMILNPICPHLGFPNALVLPSTAVIELGVHTGHEAVLSVDGQVNISLKDGDSIRIALSPNVARCLRAEPPSYFYGTLMKRLVQK